MVLFYYDLAFTVRNGKTRRPTHAMIDNPGMRNNKFEVIQGFPSVVNKIILSYHSTTFNEENRWLNLGIPEYKIKRWLCLTIATEAELADL